MTAQPIRLGPFEVDAIIGRGGMGEIWRGVHLPQQVPIAVKVLTEHSARREEYLRQFRNEIRSVAALDHPGIILVFDHGEVSEQAAAASEGSLIAGSPYLVMELARGGALSNYIARLNWPGTRHILFNVLDALAHAHARGVVHRDLKPHNILVGCRRGDRMGLKLADFGLAHPLDLTGRTGTFDTGWGTPHYMAPEQFRGRFRDYGPHTDLYALGVVAWELTTGTCPFDGANVVEISSKHLHSELPAYEPRYLVPEGLAAWLHRLLQKEPADRFPTAADAAHSLARLLGEPATGQSERGEELFDSGGEESSRERSLTSSVDANLTPVQPLDRETSTPGDAAGPQGADTLHEIGATTRLLNIAGDDAPPVNHAVTVDFSGWGEPIARAASNTTDGEAGANVELAAVVSPPLPDDWRQPVQDAPSAQLLGAGLGLFGLRTVRLVDRDAERDWLWDKLAEVHRLHEARLALLEGGAGTGKSRLARWLTERANEVGGAQVLAAVHGPVLGPTDGLSGMVARHFGCVGLEREAISRRLESVLRRQGVTEPYEWNALTELIVPRGGLDTKQKGSVRFRTTRQRYALLRRMLERIARRRPLILWLDDVQWGADALGLAAHMLEIQRATRSPIFMVLTARSEMLADRPTERAILERLMEREHAQSLSIGELPAADTSELVRRLLKLDGDLAAQVEQRSDGNPLFAVQLVDDWVSAGKLTVGPRGFELRDGESATLPDHIHQLWCDRIEQVAQLEGEQSLLGLEVAAAFGQEVAQEEWLEACRRVCESPSRGHDLEHLLDLDETLFVRGLARPIDGGWRFVHGMLRESLERLSREGGRFARLNGVCADVLADLYGAQNHAVAQRRAHHLIEADRLADALEPLRIAAGFHADRSDFQAAHDLLDRRGDILSALDVEESSPRWPEGWVLRSQIFEHEANYGSALTWAEMAVEHARGHGCPDLLAPSLRAAGRAHLHLGDFTRAHSCFSEARSLAEADGAAPEVALSLLGLGRVAQRRGDFDTAAAHLERAARLLEKGDDELGLARCYNALGDIARQRRQLEQARGFAEKARALFDADGHQVGVADCLNDLSELSLLQGEVERAEELCERAIQLYESVGSNQSMRVKLHLAFIELHRGEFDKARAAVASTRQYFEREAQLGALAHADVLLLACAAAEGDWAIFDELLEEATTLALQTGLRAPRIGHAATIGAELAEELDEFERANAARALAQRFLGK
ncbi:MAG: protein kinase domain-containing protein [Persicimonas sp.]